MATINCKITGPQLQHIVKAAKAIRPDPLVLRFCDDGLRLSIVDMGQVVMMMYHIHIEKLKDYKLEASAPGEELEVHVDLNKLDEAAKVVGKKGEIELFHDTTVPKLIFKAGRVKRDIPTIFELKEFRRELPKNLNLDRSFVVSGNEFLEDLSAIESVAEAVYVELKDGRVRLHTNQHEDSIEIVYQKEECSPSDNAASGLFTVSYLRDILSGTAGENVTFQFGTNLPLRVVYSNDTGDYIALCAPRIEEE